MRRLFYNGNIITMNKDFLCDAMVVEGDKIIAVGKKAEIEKMAGESELIDLKGCTVLPAFVDAHSHILAMANTFLQVDLTGIYNIEEIYKKIRECNSEIVRCCNLSNEILLDEDFLDSFEPVVVIQHNSGHSGFFNKKAQELININSYFLQENELLEALKKLPFPNIEEIIIAFEKAEEIYMSNGITVVQEGILLDEMVPMYNEIVKRNKLKLDVIAYKDLKTKLVPKDDKFKIGGYKIFLDGSPQGKTAWVSKPYENTNEYGISTMTDEEVDNAIKTAIKNNLQIIAHCNGDMAINQFINGIENNKKASLLRPVIIHGQLMTKEQLIKAKELNIIPSFFIAHIYHYGDIHIRNLGERANYISPLKSATMLGIYPTIHQDSPIIAPNMFESIWCAVERRTKNGILLGEFERVSVYEAIKTVTINSARQYFMENERGSIEKGKRADFIIIDKDPLNINIEEIRNIKVNNLYKNGELIYTRQ